MSFDETSLWSEINLRVFSIVRLGDSSVFIAHCCAAVERHDLQRKIWRRLRHLAANDGENLDNFHRRTPKSGTRQEVGEFHLRQVDDLQHDIG